MLQWIAAGEGKRFMALIHHPDAQRKYAYDRGSHIGKLGAALGQTMRDERTVVDMKVGWNTIYSPE